jgi:hypothetical protein
MICDHCTQAGEENKLGHLKRAAHKHEKCVGCECQHKIGPGYARQKDSKVPLMQTQSP